MKTKIICMISFIFAAASYGGNYYFTKGFEDQATYTRNFSDLNNWAVSEVQYDNDYYNSDAIKSSTLPGVGDVIVLGRDSNYNGPTYEAGVTDILYIDTDVLVGGINQNTGSPYTKTTVVMAKDGGTLTFDSTKNTQILNKSFDSEDFRLAMDFTVNYGNNAGFTNSSNNDLYIGAANGSSVAELKTSDGTANGSIKEWQFNVTGSGNIIVNTKLASIKSTTVFINGGGTGKTIFQGNAASDINTITLATEAIVAFDMRDAMVTSMGTFTFEITLRQNSRLEFCGNNQVPLLTEIRLKNHPSSSNAGVIALQGFDLEVSKINYWLDQYGYVTGTLDFGENSNAQNLIIGNGIVLSGTKMGEFDSSKTELHIANYVKGEDKIMMGTKLDSELESTLIFDGIGDKGIDWELVSFMNDYGMWEYSYNIIPESSYFAAIFGVGALLYGLRRRRK